MPDVPMGSKGAPITINLTNEGYSDLSVPSIGTDSSDFRCPTPRRQQARLWFPPKKPRRSRSCFHRRRLASRTGTLTLTSNEPPGSPASDKTIALAGTATQPQFKVDVVARLWHGEHWRIDTDQARRAIECG